jgi:hypothetical protein
MTPKTSRSHSIILVLDSTTRVNHCIEDAVNRKRARIERRQANKAKHGGSGLNDSSLAADCNDDDLAVGSCGS